MLALSVAYHVDQKRKRVPSWKLEGRHVVCPCGEPAAWVRWTPHPVMVY